ncbi:MAG: hypothetical protein LBH44_13040 [Treponema sp.]|jgi:TolB-like protein|nr:hypothetical protein [Treponema sp.]
MKKAIALAVLGMMFVFAAAAQTELDAAIQQAGNALSLKFFGGPKVALLNFNSATEDFSAYALSEMARFLTGKKTCTVIARADTDRALSEANLKVSGAVSDAAAREIGRKLNAAHVVTGVLEKTGETYRFRTRTITVTTGSILAESNIALREGAKLQQLLALNNAPPPPAVVTPPPVTPPATVVTPPPAADPQKPIVIPAGFIPQYAIDEAVKTRAELLKENSQSASDFTWRFFYNKEGYAVLEFTVVPKAGYRWPQPTWEAQYWGNSSGAIGNGVIKFTVTKKAQDEAQYRMDERRKDPVFREIEKVVLQIAAEYQYDFEKAYGIKVKYRNPNIKKAVCEGYSDAVAKAFANHPHVASVETWSSSTGNHAWNVIILKDGRKIYCDSTWYQGNYIDKEGYVVDIPDQNPVALTFDIAEFNSMGGAVNTSNNRLLDVHHGWSDAKLSR